MALKSLPLEAIIQAQIDRKQAEADAIMFVAISSAPLTAALVRTSIFAYNDAGFVLFTLILLVLVGRVAQKRISEVL